MSFSLCSHENFIRKISVFQNEKHFYFVGTRQSKKKFSLFTFKKLNFPDKNINPLEFKLKDLIHEYKERSLEQFQDLNNKLEKEVNTKLRFLQEANALLGFFSLNLGYYAILITGISRVGKIGDNIINKVDKIKILPLFTINDEYNTEHEKKYLSMFQDFVLCNQSYFSYTYDLTKSLQRNFVEKVKQKTSISKENNFIWNHYHLEEFEKHIKNKSWVIYFVYGFFEQIHCCVYGLRFYVTVIARRNRHFAGTRYLKRGISDDGNVGNDVETEQILEEISTTTPHNPNIASYIHIRGSVPIYWYQIKKRIEPKPDIKINYSDVFYQATRFHFNNLIKRYGHPIIACNLTKKNEEHKQEVLLNDSYSAAINLINNSIPRQEFKLFYYHFDLKHERKDHRFYHKFFEISQNLIDCTNMFAFIPNIRSENSFKLLLQSGVIRSNCVDCLDRTNVFQQFIGTAVMFNQLALMGIKLKAPVSNDESEMFGVLTEIYKRMGHVLSSQYAGSEAHKQSIQENRSTLTRLIDKVPELINTVKRYLNNSWNDTHKQMCINLFLGKFQPKIHIPKFLMELWELPNDIILHKQDCFSSLLEDLDKNWWVNSFDYYKRFSLMENVGYLEKEGIYLEKSNFSATSISNKNSKSDSNSKSKKISRYNHKNEDNDDNSSSSASKIRVKDGISKSKYGKNKSTTGVDDNSQNLFSNIQKPKITNSLVVILKEFKKKEIERCRRIREGEYCSSINNSYCGNKTNTVFNNNIAYFNSDINSSKTDNNSALIQNNSLFKNNMLDNSNVNNYHKEDNINNNNNINTNIKVINTNINNKTKDKVDVLLKNINTTVNNNIDEDNDIDNQNNLKMKHKTFITLDTNKPRLNKMLSMDSNATKITANANDYLTHTPFMFLDIDNKTHMKTFKVTNYYDKNTLVKKPENIPNSKIMRLEKPKYDLMFPLDIEENYNPNEYLDPDLNSSEYKVLDDFNNCIINKKVFDEEKFDDRDVIDKAFDFNNNEFVEDMKKLNKKKIKRKIITNEEYIIYDIDDNQFYKKINSFGGIFNMFNTSRNKSPKIEIKKPAKIGIKVIDDYIL